MIQEEHFIAKNKDAWARLEWYNNKLGKTKLSRLSRGEIKEYVTLFRAASHHLSYAKTYFEGSRSIDYLNQLLGASHTYFYARQKTALRDILNYFASGFPRAVRQYYKYLAASVCVFMAGVLFILILTYQDSSYMYYFLPEGMEEANNITGQLSDDTWFYPLLSSYIMTNNIRVCALAIAYGVTAGLGTVYILLYNGLALGAFYAMVLVNNMSQPRFWSLILPHGFIELTAIFIAGAAGFIIGRAMLIPGDMTRRGSFVKGAKKAFYFLPGLTVMLIIAGVIEGFFTPLNIMDEIKLVFALVTLLLLIVYFGFCGRDKKGEAVTARALP